LIKKLNRRLGERGQIILMVGLATIVMFGIVGLAVDVGRLYVTRVELGRSLDAAALSGILELNGQQTGLDNAEERATDYFVENEGVSDCSGDEGITCTVFADPNVNELTMDGTKTIKLIFLSVLGIKTASVSAHAKAGFGTQYLDAALVLDATPSMQGNPIVSARNAAITFKDILLGANPQGNVLVGVTPFRGCFNPPRSYSDCITNSMWSDLSYDSSDLDSIINNISASSGFSSSATNVCTGLAKGWDIVGNTSLNHDDDVAYPDNQQFLILLSDGDNAYWGNRSYQNDGSDWVGTNAPFSPTGTTIDGTDYPCMPYDDCGFPWPGESNDSDEPCEDDTIGTSDVGELDDTDGSSPQTCSDDVTPRERQMDARTIHLAQAIKAQGVEVFVVAFAGGVPYCDLGDGKIYDDSNPSDCNSVAQSPAGPIGNGDDDNDTADPANTRLLKCIASSSAGTNDHYYYANDDTELVGIFTAIANQIAHRLIE
jgi:Flp pilus assembly protein TadG